MRVIPAPNEPEDKALPSAGFGKAKATMGETRIATSKELAIRTIMKLGRNGRGV